MEVYVLSRPISFLKSTKNPILYTFNTRKEAYKWLKNQLREYESFYIDMALEMGLVNTKNVNKLPTKKEMVQHFIIEEHQLNLFKTKYI